MSFQLFISDIQKEPLTSTRLQEVWEFCNLKNKSPLIDPLTQLLFKSIDKRENGTIPVNEVAQMCKRYQNGIVKKLIEPQHPLLEPLPDGIPNALSEYAWNPPTGIVFRPKTLDIKISKENKPSDWIATQVIKGKRLYPLRLGQLLVCTTNGWFFETDNEEISSPFKV